jgi:copper homeostasis protein
MSQPRVLLEVAVASLDDALTAVVAGADRLELNSALELGGLTPSPALIEFVCPLGLPTIVMSRPRPGGFAYSPAEFDTLARDAAFALRHGAAGVAFGCLHPDHTIDRDRAAEIVRLAGGTQTVFHRAFDLTPDPLAALDTLIELGVTRVLTSGQAASAPLGAPLIRRLVEHAAGRIEILPGAGIRPENVALMLAQTAATQIHGSFSVERDDPAHPVCPGRFRATCGATIRLVRQHAL